MHLNVGYLGLAFVLLGAMVLAPPTLGFETIAADRPTQVSTAQDSSALLGVVDNSGSADSEIKHNSPGVVYYLDDNAGEFPSATDIQAEVVSFDGASTGLTATVQSSTTTNDYEVVVDCGTADFNGQGTVTVSIEATGDVAVVMERTTTQQVTVKCSGGGNGGTGPASFVAGDVTTDGTQSLSFDGGVLKNKEWVTIDLTDAQGSLVDYSNATVTVNQSTRDVRFQDGVLEIQAGGGWNGDVGVTVSNVDVLQSGTATAQYSDDRGRSDSDDFSVP